MRDHLVILQSGTDLTAALCRVGLKARTVPFLRHASCATLTAEAAEAALNELLDALKQEHLNIPGDVRLCLSAENALFREWTFPFRSRARIEQALTLMLETEFPFEPDALVHRICLAGNAGKGMRAISVSLRRSDLDFWLDALAGANLFPGLVTVDPFPLCASLPGHCSGLLVQSGKTSADAVLMANGFIERIRLVPVGYADAMPGSDPETGAPDASENTARDFAARLHQDVALALEGQPAAPERLYAYGGMFLHGAAFLGEAFGLPVTVPGQDVPLAGQLARLGETDPDRLLALCVAAMPGAARWRPFPSFHRAAQRNGIPGKYRKLLTAACWVLCVGAAGLVSVFAEGYADGQRARGYDRSTQEVFRKAAPDARGTFNVIQMESILRARVEKLRGSSGGVSFPTLHLLQAMHEAVPPALTVRFDRLNLDEKHCSLSGTAGGYDQVNALRLALAGIPGVDEARLLSAANRTGRQDPGIPEGAVLFEIELSLQGARP